MREQAQAKRVWIVALLATLLVAALYHTDIIGRVAYAVERGRIEADWQHLNAIDDGDIASVEQLSHAFSVIADVAKPSVVNIEALSSRDLSGELKALLDQKNFQLRPSIGTGSGVILDTDGHIVTNNHVLADSETIVVTLADRRVFRAERIGTDPMTDLAVIKIDADRLHPATFGDSDRMKVGHIVLAIGSPFRLGHSVTHGIISALGRSNIAVDIDYQNWIQTDAQINPGNSGGPLINARGEVVALNTAIATERGSHQGVGFAIPSNTVVRIAELLKTGRKIQRGYLGVAIQPVTPKLADAYGLKEASGAFIGNIGPDSPAEKGGLQDEDIILDIDGEETVTRERLQQIVAATIPGTEVDMTIWRDGAALHKKIVIGAQPENFSARGWIRDLYRWKDNADEGDNDDEGLAAPPVLDAGGDREPDDATEASRVEVDFATLGFRVGTVSRKLKKRFNLNDRLRDGAVITHVVPTGEAYAAGLLPGQVIVRVNRERIRSARDLEKVLTPEAVTKGVRLKIRISAKSAPGDEDKPNRDAYFYAVLRVR